MCSLYRSTNLLSSKYNSTYNHYCPNNWQQKWVHISEHVKTVSKVSIFCRGTIVTSTALILLGMEFTRAAQFVAGILFHSSIMASRSLLDVRHMVLLHLPLEDAPHVLNRVHGLETYLATPLPSPSAARAVVILVVCLLCWKTVSEGRASSSASECPQYMLESMFPSMNHSSPVPAVVMQPHTMMLLPPCLTVGKAQFSWYSSPGRRHTCWTPSESNKFILISSDHRTWFQ